MIDALLLSGAVFTPAYWIFFLLLRLAGRSSRFFKYGLVFWFLTTIPLLFLGSGWGPTLVLVVSYTALWVLALNVMAAIANSVTLFMLAELVQNGEPSYSSEAIKKTYDQRAALQGRLVAITEAGLVKIQDGNYHIAGRGKLLALPFAAIKKIFGISRVG